MGVAAHWSLGFRASVRSNLTYVMSFPDLPTLTMNWTLSAQSDVMQIPWPLRLMRYKAFYPVWRTSRRNWRVTHQNVPACSGEKALRPTSWLFGERQKLWADRLARCGEWKVLISGPVWLLCKDCYSFSSWVNEARQSWARLRMLLRGYASSTGLWLNFKTYWEVLKKASLHRALSEQRWKWSNSSWRTLRYGFVIDTLAYSLAFYHRFVCFF